MRDGVETRYLYAIRPVGMRGPVKFGISIEPQERITAYARWSPFPLEVAFHVPGDHKTERLIHRFCAETHSHHEWFDWSPRVQRIIDAALNGADIRALLPDDLPAHPDTENRKRAAQTKEARETRSKNMLDYWRSKRAEDARKQARP